MSSFSPLTANQKHNFEKVLYKSTFSSPPHALPTTNSPLCKGPCQKTSLLAEDTSLLVESASPTCPSLHRYAVSLAGLFCECRDLVPLPIYRNCCCIFETLMIVAQSGFLLTSWEHQVRVRKYLFQWQKVIGITSFSYQFSLVKDCWEEL